MLLRRASDKDGYAEDRFYSLQTASSAGRGIAVQRRQISQILMKRVPGES
jgi:hypothetical protein